MPSKKYLGDGNHGNFCRVIGGVVVAYHQINLLRGTQKRPNLSRPRTLYHVEGRDVNDDKYTGLYCVVGSLREALDPAVTDSSGDMKSAFCYI